MADAQNSSRNIRWIIIAVIAVVSLVTGGAGTWFFIQSNDEIPAQSEATESSAETSSSAVYYVIMPQPFIFNITGDKRSRMAQIEVNLLVRGEQNERTANHHIPLIASTLLQTFGDATVEQLRAAKGPADLRKTALADIQNVMAKVSGGSVVEQVLFTSFVMQ